MKYEEGKEMLSNYSFMIDGNEENIDTAARIISKYTEIPYKKIKTFIMAEGLKTLFDNPSLIGANEKQTRILFDLKEMIDWGFDTYESV